jgi:hypothetical protein
MLATRDYMNDGGKLLGTGSVRTNAGHLGPVRCFNPLAPDAARIPLLQDEHDESGQIRRGRQFPPGQGGELHRHRG